MKKHIPNLLTTLNLLSGCFAIVAAFENKLDWTAYFITISAIFDFLDGSVARMLNVNSEFGKQLDSLADMISFGLTPGMIMYFLLKNSNPLPDIYLYGINIIPFIGFSIPIFSALRLAKFNLDPRQTDKFFGLPTPANTLLIASIALINLKIFSKYDFLSSLTNNSWFLIILTVLSCFLLISEIQLISFKFKSFKSKENRVQYILILISVILLPIFRFTAIPIILTVYILLSILFKKK
jgi:CDP-diacylglycerol--serine O-phosphatidyltransferase